MKIYLAARYSRNAEMREHRRRLEERGHTVTSRWIDCHTDIEGDNEKSFSVEFLNAYPERCVKVADHDLDDIKNAEVLILFSDPGGGKGGRHVEYGYALALSKFVIVIGRRENVFHTVATAFAPCLDQVFPLLDRLPR